MIHPNSAYEALESGRRRTLFTLFKVPWTATVDSWQFITSRLVMGIVIALIFMDDDGLTTRLLWGLLFGALVGLSNVLHIMGHFIGGKLVGAPMDENLVTKYSILTAYHEDPAKVPGRIHLARAAGGPLMTVFVSLLSIAGWLLFDGRVLGFLAVLNMIIAFQVLLPLPGADGEVIWRELNPRSSKLD